MTAPCSVLEWDVVLTHTVPRGEKESSARIEISELRKKVSEEEKEVRLVVSGTGKRKILV